ncbi:acyl dehydratase, partial [Mycobacterium pyrenivorans]|nr:acyl dehydratase [Mycolicibacterium pyrenivorans]
PDDVHIGMPVKIAYDDIPEHDAAMYHLTPA